MKDSVLILLMILSFSNCFAQTEPNNAHKYFSKTTKKVSAKMLENKTLGIADTTLAYITGQIIDNEHRGVYYADIIITNVTNKDSSSFQTDSLGYFKFYIRAGDYSLQFRDNVYGGLIINSLKLRSGQIQEIKVSLGSRFVVEEWQKIDTIKKVKTL
jgi:hypothetical protein